ncbi:DUF1826 domain-containing protein [Thioalkalivibrio sp. ALJ1]|uniref:DUF1826 domain-containing protein n=1 Tax=Thioalkalivibrio sp. ALJ1 TaxID=1158144 RepID=UPI00056E5E57|nr:DUF1826 domain-containing protein [Thioalkalivibrio sp. ALJ1]
MTSAGTAHPDTRRNPSRHRFVDRAREFKGIHRNNVNALIWRRVLDPALISQAEQMAAHQQGMVLDVCCRPDQTRSRLLDASGLRPFELHYLAYDMERLAHNFAVVAQTVSVRVQLEVLNHQPCPLFHVDNNVLRMICSYTGPGTEYADDRYVRRESLRCGDNLGVLGGQAPITAKTGEVILMKGERCPTARGQGAVHRSPPIAKGHTRLLLRLDWP